MARSQRAARPAPLRKTRLLVATRKGLWTLTSDVARSGWRSPGRSSSATSSITRSPIRATARRCSPPRAPGISGRRSSARRDSGRTWKEAARPPAFAEGSGRVVDHTFWLTPGHASEPGVWYAGTSPQGLFRSADGGATWEGVDGIQRASASARRGAAATRTARRTARSCIRS